MSLQQIILGLAGFLHNLFTVVWVGGLVMFVITLLPSMKKAFGKGPQTNELMRVLLNRHRVWVYISIVGLFITGVIQARMEPTFTGLFHFDSLYSGLTSSKHLLTFLMIAIALFRSLVFSKKSQQANSQQMKFGLQLIFVNAVLGVGVLLLSGLMAAI